MTDHSQQHHGKNNSTDDALQTGIEALAASWEAESDTGNDTDADADADAGAADAAALSNDIATTRYAVDLDQRYRLLPSNLGLDERAVPGPKTPEDVATVLVSLLAQRGWRLRHWRGGWMVYRAADAGGSGRYAPAGLNNTTAVSDFIRDALRYAVHEVATKDGMEARRWPVTVATVRDVAASVEAQTRLDADIEAGTWLNPQREVEIPGTEVTCVANGLLWCPREGGAAARELLDHTPEFFTDTAVAVDYEPDAGCGRWLRFLEELWPDDEDSRALLQEWFGYVLTGATTLHKILTLVGPTRSGKSTIANVLQDLLGGVNAVDHPTMERLSQPFGLAPMVGKRLAVVGDARIGRSDHALVEKLLMISGEDPVSVNRKNMSELNVRLGTRIMIISNAMPELRDATGALAHRLMPLRIKVSGFLGKEDYGLKDALDAERAGILNWALEGADRLWARGGRFTMGDAIVSEIAAVERTMSPVKAFLADECQVWDEHGPDSAETFEVPKADLYERYVMWAHDAGVMPVGKEKLCREIYAVHPHVRAVRANRNGARVQMILGLRLTTGQD